jgi:hypothetical protein
MNINFQTQLAYIVNSYNEYWRQVQSGVTINYGVPSTPLITIPSEGMPYIFELVLEMNLYGRNRHIFLREMWTPPPGDITPNEIKEALATRAILSLAQAGIAKCWEMFAEQGRKRRKKEIEMMDPIGEYPLSVTDMVKPQSNENSPTKTGENMRSEPGNAGASGNEGDSKSMAKGSEQADWRENRGI